MAKLKQITKDHFAILGMARLHFVNYIYEEREWWADDEERVIGVVVFDKTDGDWSCMVLGRDTTGLFRGIDQKIALPSQASARANLKERLEFYADAGETVFPQADEREKKKEILTPIVPATKLHPDFKHLIEDAQYSAARRVIEETVYAFIDIDGNYVRDFQTTGFPGRLWELFLYRFLYEQEFQRHEEFERPDFCVSTGSFRIGIEAVTVNATAGEKVPKPRNKAEVRKLLDGYMPIKFGSSLFSKLRKRYWEDEHMKDVPLAFAIHDFHGGDSMTWSAPALSEYLYGVRLSSRPDAVGAETGHLEPIAEHVWNNKKIPSNFFEQPHSENVSAVLFSNASTLSKWNRMGRLAGLGDPETIMYREGLREDPDPEALKPIRFAVEVKPGDYKETWSEDIQVFHNPRAVHPLPNNLFRGCSNLFFQEGTFFAAEPSGRRVISSRTYVFSPKK